MGQQRWTGEAPCLLPYAEKDISAGAVKKTEKDPVLPACQLPKNLDNLVTKHGYNEKTHPEALAKDHRKFKNLSNNDKLNFEK